MSFMSFQSLVTFASSNPYLVAIANVAAVITVIWVVMKWGWIGCRFVWLWSTQNLKAAQRRLTFTTMTVALISYHHPSVMIAAILRMAIFTTGASILMYAQALSSLISPSLFGQQPEKWQAALFITAGHLILLRGFSYIFTLSKYVLAFHRRERIRRYRLVRAAKR
ncbi:hypothetical protein RLDS_22920 [Sphingobium lactosutens DS20]|uniref:Uncharacterized protein n=2 Tax=Sphingobium TaxID=165695 RepID=T0HGN2_9SPHN|nr:hypothetical protein RLDS_22920 [Sphingobium lactosutens DS20]